VSGLNETPFLDVMESGGWLKFVHSSAVVIADMPLCRDHALLCRLNGCSALLRAPHCTIGVALDMMALWGYTGPCYRPCSSDRNAGSRTYLEQFAKSRWQLIGFLADRWVRVRALSLLSLGCWPNAGRGDRYPPD